MSERTQHTAAGREGLLERVLYRRLRGWLQLPAADALILWIAFAMLLASLDTGLAADDYVHAVMLDRPAPIAGFAREPLDIFRFCDPRFSPALIEEGIFMWWDDPNAKLAFMRPVTALTHWLDHRLWKNNGPLLHLHSALWGLLLLLGARRLYQELIGDRFVATLAFALYALDDARGWLVSWVAARNAGVATAFSVWALVVHVRERRGRLPAGRWLGPVLLGFGLLGSEGAVATGGYLLGHALFLEQGPLVRRLLRLWPYALLVVIWRVAYHHFGYGVSGSGLYVDPLRDPLRFLQSFAENAPILLGSQLGGMWSDAWLPLFFAPKLQLAIYLLTLIFIGLVARALWQQLRAAEPEPRALAAFAAFGALFSVIPASPTFPADRLLTWIGLGASVLLAGLLAPVLRSAEPSRQLAPGARGLIAVLIVSHLVIGALFMPSRARGNLVMRNFIDRVDQHVPRDPGVRDKTLIFINPPHIPFSAYPPIERAGKGEPWPRHQHTLGTATTEIELTRVDTNTVRLRPRGGFLQNPTSRLVWSARRSFHVGEQIRQSDMRVTIRAITEDARPLEVDMRFDRALEDPAYLWRQWLGIHAAPFVPPAVGERVILPGADYAQALLGISLPFAAKF